MEGRDGPGAHTEREVQEVCEQYRPMVRSLASRITSSFNINDAFDDVVQDGMEGLVQAAHRFDSARGSEFSTFAYYRIRGAMVDGIRRMSRRGRHVDKQRIDFDESANIYLEQRAREMRKSHAGDKSRITLEVIADLATIFLLTDDSGSSLQVEAGSSNPEAVCRDRELHILMEEGLQTLPERDQSIIRKHYFHSESFESIGQELGISRSWICRLHSRALARLRNYFNTVTGEKGG